MVRRKGFTLLELIIVIIVIGILASIALPRFLRVTEKARTAEAKVALSAIRSSQIRYYAQYGAYHPRMAISAGALDCDLEEKYFTYWSFTETEDLWWIGAARRNATREYSISPPDGYWLAIMANGTIVIVPSDLSVNLDYLL